jgi:hypothetical protein
MLGAKHTAGTGWSKLQVGLEKAGSLIVTRVKLHSASSEFPAMRKEGRQDSKTDRCSYGWQEGRTARRIDVVMDGRKTGQQDRSM